jgi:hypothetical protein
VKEQLTATLKFKIKEIQDTTLKNKNASIGGRCRQRRKRTKIVHSEVRRNKCNRDTTPSIGVTHKWKLPGLKQTALDQLGVTSPATFNIPSTAVVNFNCSNLETKVSGKIIATECKI